MPLYVKDPIKIGTQVICTTPMTFHDHVQKIGDIFTVTQFKSFGSKYWNLELNNSRYIYDGRRFDIYDNGKNINIYDDPTYAELFE